MRLLSLVLLASLAAFTASAAPPRPNLVLILADDLGYGDLGCFGQEKIATPHLDQLARDGVRLTRFYAGSTVCAPSRSVLMTGLHLGRTPVRGNAGKQDRTIQCLKDGDLTLAEVLQRAGYATALVGKWGLGQEGGPGLPTQKGFDHFYGYLDQYHAHNPYPPFLIRGETREALGNLPAEKVPPEMWAIGAGWSTNKVDYAPDRLTADALAWVERQSAEKPFLLFWSLITPHANNEATGPTGNGQEIPDLGAYADRDWPEPDKAFAATVSRLDADVGRLLALLRRKGLEENTLVIFTSDNGPHREGRNRPDFFASSGPLRGLKRSLTEGGIRVPTIAHWPGRIPPGRQHDRPLWFADFLPTFAELAGAPIPAGLDGQSFVADLVDPARRPDAPRTFYWEFHEGGFHQALILDGRWKAIRLQRLSAPVAIHDLESDPGEATDLAAVRPDLVERAQALFVSLREDNPAWPIRETPPPKPAGQKKAP
jgi:uncharacterized sulfatase